MSRVWDSLNYFFRESCGSMQNQCEEKFFEKFFLEIFFLVHEKIFAREKKMATQVAREKFFSREKNLGLELGQSYGEGSEKFPSGSKMTKDSYDETCNIKPSASLCSAS